MTIAPGRVVAALAFRVIQILLLPVALVGYVLFLVKVIMYSRRSGISATALASLYARWMQHALGTRSDQPCVRLMPALPNVSRSGLRLVTLPTLLAHRVTGYVPRIYRYPYEGDPLIRHAAAARATFFDAALARHLGDVGQFVILGAGYDTRAYRLLAGTRARCFEVDIATTQQTKREVLEQAGVDTSRVTFVPADFQEENWLGRLVSAGFHPDEPTFFLWEAVTMYMDREAVERTLRMIAGTAAGTVVAFDYFTAETVEGRSVVMRYSRPVLDAVGEPMRFGIEGTPPVRKQVARFLESCGLTMVEQRNYGKETARTRAGGGLATAVV